MITVNQRLAFLNMERKATPAQRNATTYATSMDIRNMDTSRSSRDWAKA